MAEGIMGPSPRPETPREAGSTAAPSALVTEKYKKDLAACLEVWKQSGTARVMAAASKAASEDKAAVNATVTDVAALARRETRVDTDLALENARRTAIHAAYLDMTKSSIDKALTRLNVMTASVSALTAIYTGLLAYGYASDATKGQALSLSAFVPVTFLGLTLLLATIYAAMFRRKGPAEGPPTDVDTQIKGTTSSPRSPINSCSGASLPSLRAHRPPRWDREPRLGNLAHCIARCERHIRRLVAWHGTCERARGGCSFGADLGLGDDLIGSPLWERQ